MQEFTLKTKTKICVPCVSVPAGDVISDSATAKGVKPDSAAAKYAVPSSAAAKEMIHNSKTAAYSGGSTLSPGSKANSPGADVASSDNGASKPDAVCIISHGFGSSLNGPTSQMMLDALSKAGISAIAYTFPGHGEGEQNPRDLTVTHCLDALGAVEEYARKTYPGADIYYFSSSFGAYITTIYICRCYKAGMKCASKAFYRSAAVNMPSLFLDVPEAAEKDFAALGYTVLEGYTPPLCITKEFLDEMQENQLPDLWRETFEEYSVSLSAGDPNHSADEKNDFNTGDAAPALSPNRTRNISLEMIHGSADETIEAEAAKEFAKLANVPITMVPGAGHRLMGAGEPELVVQTALEFFKR